MNKPIRTHKDWHQATTGVCACGRWTAILEGQCPECHDADYESAVEAYYLEHIEALEQQNEALVKALRIIRNGALRYSAVGIERIAQAALTQHYNEAMKDK